jgi:RNase P/RNase MRP subunit POP5
LPPHRLVALIAKLRAQVQRHKCAIKSHREHLQETAAALELVEAAARARGITITTVLVPSTQIKAQE